MMPKVVSEKLQLDMMARPDDNWNYAALKRMVTIYTHQALPARNPNDMDVDALQNGGDDDWGEDEYYDEYWGETGGEQVDSFGQWPKQGKNAGGK